MPMSPKGMIKSANLFEDQMHDINQLSVGIQKLDSIMRRSLPQPIVFKVLARPPSPAHPPSGILKKPRPKTANKPSTSNPFDCKDFWTPDMLKERSPQGSMLELYTDKSIFEVEPNKNRDN